MGLWVLSVIVSSVGTHEHTSTGQQERCRRFICGRVPHVDWSARVVVWTFMSGVFQRHKFRIQGEGLPWLLENVSGILLLVSGLILFLCNPILCHEARVTRFFHKMVWLRQGPLVVKCPIARVWRFQPSNNCCSSQPNICSVSHAFHPGQCSWCAKLN